GSDAATLRWAAAVVRLGGDVLDRADLQPGRLQRPDGGLPPGAGALDENLDLLHPVFLGAAGGSLGGHLGGEGCGLARALEAHLARGGPSDDATRRVGQRDDGVVEGRLDIGVAVGNILPLFATWPARRRRGAGLGRHAVLLSGRRTGGAGLL